MSVKTLITAVFRSAGLRKSKTVAWAVLLVLTPALVSTAATAYIQGETMMALLGIVLALLSALVFVVSFLYEIPMEENLNEWAKQVAEGEADEAIEEAAGILRAQGYEVDIDDPGGVLLELARIVAQDGDGDG